MKQEIRNYSASLRAADDGDEFCLEGRACSYNTLSGDLGGFRERLAPGCFTRSLAEHDVKALHNHNSDHVLGSEKSGTLNIFDEPNGLSFKVRLDPQNSHHKNVHAMVKRGDVSECSFGFTMPYGDDGEAWDSAVDENGKEFVRRTVKAARLHEISVVAFPAYDAEGSTSVSARKVYSSRRILSGQTQSAPPPLSASPAVIDEYNKRRAQEIADDIWFDENVKPRIAAVNRAMAAERAAELAAENERNSDAGLQRRIEAANRAVAADRSKGDIS